MSTIQFNADVAAFAKKLELNLGEACQRITADLWTRITERTPVKTGRARSNWDMTTGSPSTKLQAGDSFGPSPSLPPGIDKITGKEEIFIVNNLPYIERLENGWSQQAPAGMVRLSMAEIEAEIEQLIAGIDT